jgi:protein-S-isoprenylcysteine O-methyltransferase Ste14
MALLFVAVRALFYITCFVWFFGWLGLQVQAYDERFGFVLPQWTELPGMFLMATGVVLVLACAWVFIVRGRGTPAVFDPPRQFVAAGPYRFVRNPMYIGGLSMLAGFGLARRSGSILCLALALSAVIHIFVIFAEEPGLENRFGQSYVDYKKSTNRWLLKFP